MGKELIEKAARTTLKLAHLKGHVYIELRQVGKHPRPILFCMLCQAQCFNDSVLDAHLNGNFHVRRLAYARSTLFGPNPWPFNDGVLFFSNSSENNANSVGKKNKLLVIPGVLLKEEIENLTVRFIGYGHIGARLHENNEGSQNISRIWCAWLGEGNSDDCKKLLLSPKCDFAIVTFSYTHDLGRKDILDKLEAPLSPNDYLEVDELGNCIKKRKQSFSDPEDSLNDSNGKASECSDDGSSEFCSEKLNSNRLARYKLKQKRLNAGRLCDICCHPMLIGKDVSTFLNCRTGKLACSSRNSSGAFHLYHTSCLIHWILLCEYEIWSDKVKNVKPAARGRKAKSTQKNRLFTLCPQCQGGINFDGEVTERPTIPLSEMFLHKLKAIEAHKEWMKKPETLNKCSTGLNFSSDSSVEPNVQDKVLPLSLLWFYRAEE